MFVMSETKKPVSITEARSLEDQPARKRHLLRKQGVRPATNKAQQLLERAAGGVQAGETSANARRRGLRRGVATMLAPIVLVASLAALEGVKKAASEVSDSASKSLHDRNVKPLLDFENGFKLPKGMVAVNSGNFEGTATGWAREHAADLKDADATQDLISRVADQSDMQGYPGVEPDELFVVPRSELSADTIRDLEITAG